MKRIISFISIFVLFINLFAFPVPVKADSLPVPGYTELKDIQQDIENGDNRTLQDIWKVLQPIGQAVGVVMNPIQTIEFIRDIVDPVAQTLPDYPTNGSDTDKANYITSYISNNTSTNDNNKTYTLNQNAKNLINGVVNNYIDNSGYMYLYPVKLTLTFSHFPSGDVYNAYRQFVNQYQDNFYCFYYTGANNAIRCIAYKKSPYLVGLYGTDIVQSNYTASSFYLYDTRTWELFDFSNTEVYRFQYNTVTKTFESLPFAQYPFRDDNGYYGLYDDDIAVSSLFSNYRWYIANNSGLIKVYKTLNDLKGGSVGFQPYYISNKYSNFKSSTGDFTVDSSNSNNVTYGDVNTYITDSYNRTGEFPSIPEIQIYIDNNQPTVTPTPNPDNPSGGGNNNGGTVSGNTNNGGAASASATANNNGVNVTVNNNHNINFSVPGLSSNGIGSGTVSGNGNGSGGIFDWISDIGSVIGDFIKNVGELIADVVKGITETITTILADIPNIISVLVEFVYGGLPDELKAIVTLGITTVIFVGVIKMMRK